MNNLELYGCELRNLYYEDRISTISYIEKIINGENYNIKIDYDIHGSESRFDDEGYYVITVPRRMTMTYIGVMVAYELGKLIFSCSKIPIIYFLFGLLLPEKHFREVCKEYNNNVENVAYVLDVTNSLASMRMFDLDIKDSGYCY